MTSRKKISAITKAAGKYNVSVLLKVGCSPGIMLCEGAEGGKDGGAGEAGGVRGWESVIRVCALISLILGDDGGDDDRDEEARRRVSFGLRGLMSVVWGTSHLSPGAVRVFFEITPPRVRSRRRE